MILIQRPKNFTKGIFDLPKKVLGSFLVFELSKNMVLFGGAPA